MEIKQKVLSDLKVAMKARDTLKVDTLRILNSEIKNREIDLRQELAEDELLSLLTSQIKRRREAAALYEQGNRPELKEKEEQEIRILEAYLPAQASDDDLIARIGEVVRETGASGPRDMGKVMKVVASEFKGKADGSRIKELVMAQLPG